MLVSDVSDLPFGTERRLRATVAFEKEPVEVRELYLERPDPGEAGAGIADPLLATLLVSAMALGEDLRIEAPVSAPLLEAAQSLVVPRLLAWHPRLHPVTVHVATRVEEPPVSGPRNVAGLFSAGVDSWHTLLRRDAEIDALVHIHGFEIHHEHEELWKQVHEHVTAVARERGKTLVPVRTNALEVALQAVTDRLARSERPWRSLGTDAWYGTMLVAVGRALRPRTERLLVPGSWSHHVDYPVASHPLMEPAWSTPSQQFEIDGFETLRIDKVREIAKRAPEALADLRVCIDTSGRVGPRLNCGRCVKCMRLWMELRVCGLAIPEGLFSEPVKLRRARRLRFHVDPVLWGELRDAAEAAGEGEIADTIRIMLDEKLHLPRLYKDLRRAMKRGDWSQVRWPGRRR